MELTGLTGQTPSAGCLFLAPAVAISSHTEDRWFCRNPLCPHSLCLFHAFWSDCAGLLRVLCLFNLTDIFFVSLRASEARGLEQRLKDSRDAISESCLFSGNPITCRCCENVSLCTSFSNSTASKKESVIIMFLIPFREDPCLSAWTFCLDP